MNADKNKDADGYIYICVYLRESASNIKKQSV